MNLTLLKFVLKLKCIFDLIILLVEINYNKFFQWLLFCKLTFLVDNQTNFGAPTNKMKKTLW
jgi:hypothetical protein